MITFSCSGLPEAPLLANTSLKFARAFRELRQNGDPLTPDSVPDFSAILVNNTSEPILGAVEIWEYANGRGVGEATLTPLASSSGIEGYERRTHAGPSSWIDR